MDKQLFDSKYVHVKYNCKICVNIIHTCNRVMLIITVFNANCIASVSEKISSISSANL